MVRAVGIMLCFHAYGRMFGVAIAMLTSKRGIEKVTRVNLYARFVGKHLQHNSRLRTVQRGRHSMFVGLSVVPSIQAPVMVEPTCIACHDKALVVDVFT